MKGLLVKELEGVDRRVPIWKKAFFLGLLPLIAPATYLWGSSRSTLGIQTGDLIFAVFGWLFATGVSYVGFRMGLKIRESRQRADRN